MFRQKKAASDEINKLRFSGKEYFFAYDYNGITQVLGSDVSKVGTDRSNIEDKKGVKLVQEMIKVCKESGEGYVTYHYPKLGQQEALPKLSYVKYFEPWGWLIGTGVYIDDLNSEMAAFKTKAYTPVLIVILIVFIISYLVSKIITKPIKQMVSVAKEIADGNFDVSIDIEQDDEVGALANAFSELTGSIKSMDTEVNALVGSTIQGQLTVRGNAGKYKGGFKKIIEGVNKMLDSVVQSAERSG